MPNPLTPRDLSPRDQEFYDRILLNVDWLLYTANRTFMLEQTQKGPRHPRQPMNRRELLELLRRLLRPIGRIPSSSSANDRDRYREMLSLISSLRITVTDDFMQEAEATRSDFVHDFLGKIHPVFQALGCGDLCYEKERGCVEC